MSSPPSRNQGLSLFPSPDSSKPPTAPMFRNGTPGPRRSESRERRAPTPQDRRAPTPQADSVPAAHPANEAAGRHTPQQQQQQRVRNQTWDSTSRSPINETQRHHRQDTQQQTDPRPMQQSRRAADVPNRTDTGFSDANTLVRTNSARSRSSIAKLPLYDANSAPSAEPQQQPLRSIFPTYNPDLPLEQQQYAPTQLSPTRIPREIISRQGAHRFDDEPDEIEQQQEPVLEGGEQQYQRQHQRVHSPAQSPRMREASTWPRRMNRDPPTVPQACTTEQLKSLWKVTNGWKASVSEGRVYCLKLSQERDAPAYKLSSSSAQPFYHLRLDPTSTSAYVSVTKYDPNKPYKGSKSENGASSSSSSLSGLAGDGPSSSTTKNADSKHWQDALSTSLEEESRKHPPNDGLVAFLMPTPASKMAEEKADDPSAVAVAEQECARLVWDHDSARYYLDHAALQHPFCITVERSPAWSRVEYTLEHNESPRHLAKLTRDGTGGGWVEVDTGIASQIDCFYIIDVAVTALMLVAASDDRGSSAPAETFEPPPPAILAAAKRASAGPLRKVIGGDKTRKKDAVSRVEEFEIDVESQDDSLAKSKAKVKSQAKSAVDELPFVIRVVVKLVKGLFKCFIFLLTIAFKCVGVVFKGLYKCVGSKY